MQEESSPKFADRLKRAMAACGMKASRLADESQVSKGYVSQLLHGSKDEPSFETVKKFAVVLQVSPAWLLYGDQEAAILREDPTPYRSEPRKEPSLMEQVEDLRRLYSETKVDIAEANRKLDALIDLIKGDATK